MQHWASQEDPTGVGFGGLSGFRPAMIQSSVVMLSEVAGALGIHSFLITLGRIESSGLQK